MSCVAHMIQNYLTVTENWMYEYIHRHEQFPPLVLTNRAQNLELFKLANGQIASLEQRTLWQRGRDKLVRQLGGPAYMTYVEHVRRAGCRIIHAHYGDIGWQSRWVARRSGAALLTSFYGYDLSMLPRDPLWRERYVELFRDGTRCIVMAESMAQELVKLGCPREKIAVIPMGINLELFRFQARPWDGSGPINVLMVASLVPKKGHLVALEALVRLRPAYPQLRLHLVGDGLLRSKIELFIAQHNLGDCVILHGQLPYATAGMPGDQAHLFLLPSLTAADGNQEGLPTVLIEAQARGIPVIATNHAAIPAVVEHGSSGLLAREGDVDSLVEQWQTMLEHCAQWPAMGAAGRAIVEDRFDAQKQALCFEALYAEVEASL